MSVIDAAKRLHNAYEWRVWRARRIGYTRRTWEQLDHVCRQEFIDIAQAVHDGHTTFNGHPITEWVRHHAKETTTMSHNDWPTSELARAWTHRGITCRVYVADYFNRGYKRPNGYVELPEDHPARPLDLQFDDVDVFDVHGGITYGGDGARVIGWDTAHCDDNWTGDPAKPGRLWTVDDVEDETTRLADQVADLYTPEAVAMFKASRTLREIADELDPTKETHA